MQKLLTEGLSALNITYGGHTIELFQKYYDFYAEYNTKVNLSAIETPDEFAVKHVLDSAAGLTFFYPAIPTADIGSGGGFPGVVLKILNPQLDISLVEVIEKKVLFLKQLTAHLGLNIEVFNTSRGKIPIKFGCVTCRAFGSIEKIIREARKISVKTARIIAYKGKLDKINEEMPTHLQKKAVIHPLKVPFLEAERNMVLINL